MKYKTCNVCHKELRRKHPSCNRRAVFERRATKASALVSIGRTPEAPVGASAGPRMDPVGQTVSTIVAGEGKQQHAGRTINGPTSPDALRARASTGAASMSSGIQAMGQPERDAILNRMRKIKE